MVNIVCDSCKKTIQGAMKDVNVVYIADKNICIPCKQQLEHKLKCDMPNKSPYSLKAYWDAYMKSLYSMCK